MTNDSVLVYSTTTPADSARDRINADAQAAANLIIERNDNNET